MSAERLDLDELVEHWTLLDGDRGLVAGKRGSARLAFALMLKFCACHGRFPDGDGELPGEVVEFVARQVQVSGDALRGNQFSERTDRAITVRRSASTSVFASAPSRTPRRFRGGWR